MLFGYWPPTDIGIATRHGMLWKWRNNDQNIPKGDYIFDIKTFTPTFQQALGYSVFPTGGGGFGVSANKDSWGGGTGNLTVDYADTSLDFWALVQQHRPIAILSFSRGDFNKSWELEEYAFNWEQDIWTLSLYYSEIPNPTLNDVKDYTILPPAIGGNGNVPPNVGLMPMQGNPPDASRAAANDYRDMVVGGQTLKALNPAGSTRDSNLPLQKITNAIAGANIDVTPGIDGTLGPGNYVSNYMAYHVAWYREWWNALQTTEDNQKCRYSGHTHVGVSVDPAEGEKAIDVQLDILTDEIVEKFP